VTLVPDTWVTLSLWAGGVDAVESVFGPPSGALRQLAAAADRGLIVGLKRDKPHWGARKLCEFLVRRL
jgi:hypothetical protein